MILEVCYNDTPSFHPAETILPTPVTGGKTAEQIATEYANMSPCKKSQRGVVLVDRTRLTWISTYNGPPFHPDGDYGFSCTGSEKCRANCNKVSVHAEEKALIASSKHFKHGEMVHVKTIDGKLVTSGEPSCWQCSRMIVQAGLAGMWLYHEDGWIRYTAREFHQITLENCGLGEQHAWN